jgi:hypothetical protein
MSFWDRSVDSRNGSSSTFLAEGRHTFQDMKVIARDHFPQVMARLNFAVVDDSGLLRWNQLTIMIPQPITRF